MFKYFGAGQFVTKRIISSTICIVYVSTHPPFYESPTTCADASINLFKVPIEAIYTYDAVKLYAQAAHEVLSKGGDVRNGTDVVQTIIRMGKYMSDIQGIAVSNIIFYFILKVRKEHRLEYNQNVFSKIFSHYAQFSFFA
jgi:hypothetical protein